MVSVMTFNDNTEFLMYQTEDGKTKIEVRMEDKTVWLSLNQMAELFQRDKSVISRHMLLQILQQLLQMEKPIMWTIITC
jgi:hypothetical protein